MANVKISKRRIHSTANRFNKFPTEILTEILAKVASTSAIDLVKAKISCNEFLQAASDDYVFQNLNIESFPVIPWTTTTNGASNLLENCKKCGNPESLFRQGIIKYFSNNLDIDSGLECLKKAATKGHTVATYVYGIILVCYGGERRNEGLKLLFESGSNLIVDECREKVRKTINGMWVDNFIVGFGPAQEEEFKRKLENCNCKNNLPLCSSTTRPRKKLSIWELSNDQEFEDDKFSCQACLWDLEAIRFCNFLRTKCFTTPFKF
ncbi:putative F-box protein At1g67623 [Mercurialis annua]|uniref:putative F-box protein At1g67623 n=1 Tax=Mercurialis annua TaxID=3986 RepID=UPI00215DF599|nr:putative F-box protein At1g67623 [Mercurialis annua]